MLKTFSIGGVHPHENKLSAHQPIVTAEVPAGGVGVVRAVLADDEREELAAVVTLVGSMAP